MTRHFAPHVFHRHSDLAGWYEAAMSIPLGRMAVARRLALLRAIELADIETCRDTDLLRAVADLLGKAHLGQDEVSADLSRLLPRSSLIRLAAAAEAQISRLFLAEPEFAGALQSDISLLRGCMELAR